MSREIDEKIVSMQFDNKEFEENISQSLSSIDKLNKSLKFTGASKGLEEVGTAARGVDMSALGNAVETVHAKFSAFEIVAITALTRITNSAISAGKRIVSALTIDPIKTGFQEYETQINAVQTILANTQSKGTTLSDVNKALDELNTYADKTIYNFTEMTRNIGTFTAAGIDLETATNAIQGIANLAAVSGSTSQQASTAMYQLSQALSSGTLKLQDWNSVVNAGMGGQVFQDALKETARVHGIAIDDMIKKEGSFRETLKNGWITTDILTETLQKFTLTTEGLTESQIKANREMLKAKGYTEAQIDEIFKLGDTATQAATKVKTLTQLWDTLKEAAQSGWTQSWEIMVGDFEEAKELYTTISDSVGEILNKSAEARNQVLSEGLSSGWKQFLSESGIEETKLIESITKSAKEHGVVVDDLIKKHGSFEKSLKEGWLSSTILKDAIGDLHDSVANLSAEELKNKGISEEQALAMTEFGDKVLKNGSVNLDEYTEKMAKLSGRQNVIRGFTNIITNLAKVVETFGESFREIFPRMTGQQLYDITAKFKELTEKFKIGEGTIAKLKSTFKGMFAILDIGKQAILAVANAAKKIAEPFLKSFGPATNGILDFTSSLGDFLVSLDESIKAGDTFNAIFEKIGKIFEPVANAIDKAFKTISGAFKSTNDIDMSKFESLTDNLNIRFEPLTKFAEFLSKALTAIAGVLEKVAPVIFKFAGMVGDAFKKLMGFVSDAFTKAEFNVVTDLINTVLLGNILVGIRRFVGSLADFKDDTEGIVDGIKEVLDGVKTSLASLQASLKAKVLLTIASAIAILTVSLIALSLIDSEKLGDALVAISTLFIELFGSMSIFGELSEGKSFRNIEKIVNSMIKISAAILILSFALTKIAKLDWNGLTKGIVGVGSLAAILVIAATNLAKVRKKLIKGATGLILFAGAIVVLTKAVENLSKLDWNGLAKGLVGVGVLMAEVAGFIKLIDGKKLKTGTATGILILSAAINVLAKAVDKFAALSVEQLIKGLGAVAVVLAELGIFVNKTGNAKKIISTALGLTILGGAMLIFSKAVEMMGNLSWERICKGLTTMAGVLGEVCIAMNLLPKNMVSSGIGILIISGALVVLAKALNSMGGMSWDGIGKGLIALGGSLIVIATAMNFMKNALPGAAALLVISAALVVFSKAFQTFGSMSIEEVGLGILALAGSFVVLGAAGMFIGPFVPALLGLSAAVALFSLGCVAAGVGITAFAAGLTALSTAGAAGSAALVMVVTSLLSLIPLFIQKVGEGIVAFIQVIGNSATEIVGAVVSVLTAIMDGIILTIPKFVTVLTLLLETLLTLLTTYIPKIVTIGMTLLLSLLKGISDNIYQITTTVVDIIVNFINAISYELPRIIDAGFNLLIAFITGITDAISENTPIVLEALKEMFVTVVISAVTAITDMVVDFVDAGADMIGGLIEGITQKMGEVVEAAVGVVSSAVKAVKDFLGIHSPSKMFSEIGRYSDEGLIEGLLGYSGKVANAGKEVGKTAVNAVSSAVSKIAEVVENGMNSEPTIRPVLDLSNIESGTRRLNSMFSNTQALTINARMNRVNDQTNQNGESGIQNGVNVNFYQTNNSPKALNRIEIYRQTKNQISSMKEVVNSL